MISGTPPPPTPPTPPAAKDASAAKPKTRPDAKDAFETEKPLPAGFSPRRVAESPGAFGKDPTPTWGQKLAAARAAAAAAPAVTTPPGGDPGAAGLRAVMDDMRSAVAEASAMLEDVAGLVDAVAGERADGVSAPFGVADVAQVTAETAELAALVRVETIEAGKLRPRVAEVWAENARDETMRAELESLFERAAEDADAAAADAERERIESLAAERAAREAGGAARVASVRAREEKWGPKALAAAAARPLPPALDRMRRVIDEDVRRLTSAMADLEADIEAREKRARRARQMERVGAENGSPNANAALPWGPGAASAYSRRAGLRSAASVGDGANAIPASLLKSAAGSLARGFPPQRQPLLRAFGGARGGVRGTLLSASASARGGQGVDAGHRRPSATASKPPTGMEGTAREETLRELRRRRAVIDSQTARLDALAARDAKDPNSSPSVAGSSPGTSLASFSPVRRIPAFHTPGGGESPGTPGTPGTAPGTPGTPGSAFLTPFSSAGSDAGLGGGARVRVPGGGEAPRRAERPRPRGEQRRGQGRALAHLGPEGHQHGEEAEAAGGGGGGGRRSRPRAARVRGGPAGSAEGGDGDGAPETRGGDDGRVRRGVPGEGQRGVR
jgi:hypothetical protein